MSLALVGDLNISVPITAHEMYFLSTPLTSPPSSRQSDKDIGEMSRANRLTLTQIRPEDGH